MNYWKTSDGNIFYTEDAAKQHARTLQDRQIVPVSTEIREAMPAVSKDVTSTVDESIEENEASEETEQEEDEIVDLNKLTKAELQEIATSLELEFTPKTTKAQLIEMIEAVDKEVINPENEGE